MPSSRTTRQLRGNSIANAVRSVRPRGWDGDAHGAYPSTAPVGSMRVSAGDLPEAARVEWMAIADAIGKAGAEYERAIGHTP